jgi:hypothetical protein
MAKKQTELTIEGAGVAPVNVKAINDALDEYLPLKEKRCTITPKETAAKGKVVDAMHANMDKLSRNGEGAMVYRYEDLLVTLKAGKEKLLTKSASEGDDERD